MHATTVQLMHDHVRAIYHTITGKDLPETATAEPATPVSAPPPEIVAQLFSDLEALARSLPTVAERIPPFSFAPPLDAMATEKELIIEVGVPGVDKRDVRVELSHNVLVISGSRPFEGEANGRTYYRAEVPRGPFRRVVRLPFPVTGEPRVDVENGLIRIRLNRIIKAPPAKA